MILWVTKIYKLTYIKLICRKDVEAPTTYGVAGFQSFYKSKPELRRPFEHYKAFARPQVWRLAGALVIYGDLRELKLHKTDESFKTCNAYGPSLKIRSMMLMSAAKPYLSLNT